MDPQLLICFLGLAALFHTLSGTLPYLPSSLISQLHFCLLFQSFLILYIIHQSNATCKSNLCTIYVWNHANHDVTAAFANDTLPQNYIAQHGHPKICCCSGWYIQQPPPSPLCLGANHNDPTQREAIPFTEMAKIDEVRGERPCTMKYNRPVRTFWSQITCL